MSKYAFESKKPEPNFVGEKLDKPFNMKMKRDMRDALKAVAKRFNASESEVVEDILDEALQQLVSQYRLQVVQHEYSKSKDSEKAS